MQAARIRACRESSAIEVAVCVRYCQQVPNNGFGCGKFICFVPLSSFLPYLNLASCLSSHFGKIKIDGTSCFVRKRLKSGYFNGVLVVSLVCKQTSFAVDSLKIKMKCEREIQTKIPTNKKL